MYESPKKSSMTKTRRVEGVIVEEDREVMIEDIGEDASPRVPGTGPLVLMEDQELREDLRGVKKTFRAQERAKESFKREMRDNITNLKEGMKGLEEKMMSKMETSFEKMLEHMQ